MSNTKPFLVIGSMKSGTESLTRLLRSHNEIELLTDKEVTSFASVESAKRFRGKFLRSTARAAGEVSTGYMQYPLVQIDHDGIYDLFGQMRLIAILRDPFSRAVSHWRHWAQLGYNPAGAIEDHLADPDGPYVAFSSYYMQLRPWIDRFGKEAILPLKLEAYSSDPASVERRLAGFLGLSESFDCGGRAITANTADHRVVSKGVGRLLARSGFYRSIRSLLPPFLRSRGAIVLGGVRGGHQLDPTGRDIEIRFRNAIAQDMALLEREWSGLRWD